MIFDSIIPLAIFTDKIEIKMIRFILKESEYMSTSRVGSRRKTRNYEQKLSERRAWWITIFLLLGVSTIAFLYQRLRKHPTFTLFCTGYDCPPS